VTHQFGIWTVVEVVDVDLLAEGRPFVSADVEYDVVFGDVLVQVLEDELLLVCPGDATLLRG
jgi:hypothetical protein